MTTREEIIRLADDLIRDQGYNAFSFYDISKTIGIKTSSIHYHFPSKSDLGKSVINEHLDRLNRLRTNVAGKTPLEKLNAFFQIYSVIRSENKICLVGSLATDFNTIDASVQKKLKIFSDQLLNWIIEILAEGKRQKVFHFSVEPRTKAIMIISNMLAIVQLSRLTRNTDVEVVKKAIIKELTENQKK